MQCIEQGPQARWSLQSWVPDLLQGALWQVKLSVKHKGALLWPRCCFLHPCCPFRVQNSVAALRTPRPSTGVAPGSDASGSEEGAPGLNSRAANGGEAEAEADLFSLLQSSEELRSTQVGVSPALAGLSRANDSCPARVEAGGTSKSNGSCLAPWSLQDF